MVVSRREVLALLEVSFLTPGIPGHPPLLSLFLSLALFEERIRFFFRSLEVRNFTGT